MPIQYTHHLMSVGNYFSSKTPEFKIPYIRYCTDAETIISTRPLILIPFQQINNVRTFTVVYGRVVVNLHVRGTKGF